MPNVVKSVVKSSIKSAIQKGLVACITLLPAFYVYSERPEYMLEIKDHLFYPAEIAIPAGQKVKLVIYNRDDTPEEFDSFDLNREKMLFPNRRAVIFIGPLPAGRYEFFGEYNPNSARGAVLVTMPGSTRHTGQGLGQGTGIAGGLNHVD